MNKDQLYNLIEQSAFAEDISYYPYVEQILEFSLENAAVPGLPKAFKPFVKYARQDFDSISNKKIRQICAGFYSEPDILHFFYQSLNATTQKIITRMCFNGWVPYQEAQAINGGRHLIANTHDFFGNSLDLKKEVKYLQLYLKMGYQFGQAMYDNDSIDGIIEGLKMGFILPELLRAAFIEILPKPSQYELLEFTLPAGWPVQSFEKTIFKELPHILLLLQQNLIKRTKQGEYNITSCKAAQKKSGIQPFYNDSGYTRTLFLAGFIAEEKRLHQSNSTLDMIQRIFSGDYFYCMADAMLFYYGGTRLIQHYYINGHILDNLFQFITRLPEDYWVSTDNLLFYANARTFNFDLIQPGAIRDLKEPTMEMDGGVFASGSLYQQKTIIRQQAIISTVLAAASFGLIELAYDPQDPLTKPKDKVLHNGRFSACRMTSLGAYILKGKDGYQAPEEVTPTRYELSTTALEIKVSGSTEIAITHLGNWFRRAADNHLIWDKERIITRCTYLSDLKEEIRRFNQVLGMPLPDFWKITLMKWLSATGALKTVRETLTLRVSPYDQQLLKLLTQDSVLKDHCLKAEKHTIIIFAEDIAVFIKRLAKLGYLIEETDFVGPELTSFNPDTVPDSTDIHEFNLLTGQKKGK